MFLKEVILGEFSSKAFLTTRNTFINISQMGPKIVLESQKCLLAFQNSCQTSPYSNVLKLSKFGIRGNYLKNVGMNYDYLH